LLDERPGASLRDAAGVAIFMHERRLIDRWAIALDGCDAFDEPEHRTKLRYLIGNAFGALWCIQCDGGHDLMLDVQLGAPVNGSGRSLRACAKIRLTFKCLSGNCCVAATELRSMAENWLMRLCADAR